MTTETFKSRNPEIQQLIAELQLVRILNETCGLPGGRRIIFAEGLLVLTAFERFLRVLVTDAGDRATLPVLLRRALESGKLALGGIDHGTAVSCIRNVRNTLVHANYEQAAAETGMPSGRAYVENVYAAEVATLTKVLAHLMAQIDIESGHPTGGDQTAEHGA